MRGIGLKIFFVFVRILFKLLCLKMFVLFNLICYFLGGKIIRKVVYIVYSYCYGIGFSEGGREFI